MAETLRLILMGPPGSGKGTQAALLCERFQLAHISTGEILREAVADGTPAGQQAKPYVENGQLVPADLVNAIVAELFGGPKRPVRFIMDGYPRTVPQAVHFDTILQDHRLPLSAVLLLNVDEEEIVKRLKERGRADDNEDTVRKRLKIFHDNNAPMIEYYKGQGLLLTINGQGDINDIFESIVKELA